MRCLTLIVLIVLAYIFRWEIIRAGTFVLCLWGIFQVAAAALGGGRRR